MNELVNLSYYEKALPANEDRLNANTPRSHSFPGPKYRSVQKAWKCAPLSSAVVNFIDQSCAKKINICALCSYDELSSKISQTSSIFLLFHNVRCASPLEYNYT